MDGDRIANAEHADEVKERRGEIEGIAEPAIPGEEADPKTFFPNAEAYPTSGSGGLPPTAGLDDPVPTDALHPEEEHEDWDALEDPRDAKQPGRATSGPVND